MNDKAEELVALIVDLAKVLRGLNIAVREIQGYETAASIPGARWDALSVANSNADAALESYRKARGK